PPPAAVHMDDDGHRDGHLGQVQVEFERPVPGHLAVHDIRHPADGSRHAAVSWSASFRNAPFCMMASRFSVSCSTPTSSAGSPRTTSTSAGYPGVSSRTGRSITWPPYCVAARSASAGE